MDFKFFTQCNVDIFWPKSIFENEFFVFPGNSWRYAMWNLRWNLQCKHSQDRLDKIFDLDRIHPGYILSNISILPIYLGYIYKSMFYAIRGPCFMQYGVA